MASRGAGRRRNGHELRCDKDVGKVGDDDVRAGLLQRGDDPRHVGLRLRRAVVAADELSAAERVLKQVVGAEPHGCERRPQRYRRVQLGVVRAQVIEVAQDGVEHRALSRGNGLQRRNRRRCARDGQAGRRRRPVHRDGFVHRDAGNAQVEHRPGARLLANRAQRARERERGLIERGAAAARRQRAERESAGEGRVGVDDLVTEPRSADEGQRTHGRRGHEGEVHARGLSVELSPEPCLLAGRNAQSRSRRTGRERVWN